MINFGDGDEASLEIGQAPTLINIYTLGFNLTHIRSGLMSPWKERPAFLLGVHCRVPGSVFIPCGPLDWVKREPHVLCPLLTKLLPTDCVELWSHGWQGVFRRPGLRWTLSAGRISLMWAQILRRAENSSNVLGQSIAWRGGCGYGDRMNDGLNEGFGYHLCSWSS